MALYMAYTLHDVKALQYNPPFFTMNDALARRMVSELVMDPNTTVGRHPSDFKLYKIGMYDDATGIFDRLSIAEHVVDCIALVPARQPSLLDSAHWADIPGTGLQRTNGLPPQEGAK